jgi:hypothetical protein
MTCSKEQIDDYQTRLSDADKDFLLDRCNQWGIFPNICAWYDDISDFYSDWVEDIGYTKEQADDLLDIVKMQGEFIIFSDGRIVRLVK